MNALFKVQRTAHSAIGWLDKHGGQIKDKRDTVAQLARLGAAGKFSGNCERDTHRLVQRLGKRLDCQIDYRQVQLINPATLEEHWQDMPMILPHELCLALWSKGEDVFRRCLYGNMTDQDIESYWNHVEAKSVWFSSHPASRWQHRARLCGVATYGDEVQAYRNSECGVVSILGWTSELSFLNEPLCRYFATAVWSEHHESDKTYNDIIQFVVDSFKRLGDPNEPWPWRKHGYLICFTAAQGDLKWINERMGLHNYRRNDFCSRCECVKTSENGNAMESLTNFTADETAFSLRDYSGVDRAATYSPLFELPLALERVQHDVAHSQLLGTGKATNGATLIYLAEAGVWGSIMGAGEYKDKLAIVLRRAHRDFLLYKKMYKLQCSQPRFTPARLGRKTQKSVLEQIMHVCLFLCG